MIRTSSYDLCKANCYVKYFVELPKEGKVQKAFLPLIPTSPYFLEWDKNGDLESEKKYIERYYNEVLSKLDPEETYSRLIYSVLIDYGKTSSLCNRHIIAAWFELFLDVEVPEINLDEPKLERPNYIKEYLEQIIKANKNMRGFSSLRALYLFEQGEQLENRANELEQLGKDSSDLRQDACFYRCDADEVEKEYRGKQLIKTQN